MKKKMKKMSLSLEELASVLSSLHRVGIGFGIVTCEILAVREWTTLVIVKNVFDVCSILCTIVAHICRRYNLQLTTDVEIGNG